MAAAAASKDTHARPTRFCYAPGRGAAAAISPPLATSFCHVAYSALFVLLPIELRAEEEVAGAELFGCVRDGEAREAASFINKTKGRWLALRTLPVDKTRFGWVGSVRPVPCARFVGIWQA